MTLCRIVPVAVAWLACGGGIPAQEHAPEDTSVRLPEVPAFRMSDGRYLLFSMRLDKPHFDYLRDLRRLGAAPAGGEPASLVFDTLLHRRSKAFDTELCYVESDWMSAGDLAASASLVHRSEKLLGDLFGPLRVSKRRYVVTDTKEHYLELVDKRAADEATRQKARHVHSLPVGDTRCGYEKDVPEALSMVVTDLVMNWSPPSLAAPSALREGIHVYLSAVLTGDFHCVVSLTATSPDRRGKGRVEELIGSAREFLSRPKRESLEEILRTELNAITLERLSVMFAMIDFLLRTRRDRWPDFVRRLEAESQEDGKLKGAEGLHQALRTALKESMDLELQDLEARLKEFVAREYLLEVELARLCGIDRECAESVFSGFEKVCELRRQGKPVSEKGDRIYQDILGRVRKKLAIGKEAY